MSKNVRAVDSQHEEAAPNEVLCQPRECSFSLKEELSNHFARRENVCKSEKASHIALPIETIQKHRRTHSHSELPVEALPDLLLSTSFYQQVTEQALTITLAEQVMHLGH